MNHLSILALCLVAATAQDVCGFDSFTVPYGGPCVYNDPKDCDCFEIEACKEDGTCGCGLGQNEPETGTCVMCPLGSTGDGSATCTPCPVGHFSKWDYASQPCYECTRGTYADVEGSSACKLCEDGMHSTNGATVCNDCLAGKYVDAENKCIECSPGSYSKWSSLEACSMCEPGRYAKSPGATSCELCDSGTHSTSTGATACVSCAPGRYADGLGLTTCAECNPGRYSDVQGATSCTLCGGKEHSCEGATSCSKCTNFLVPGRRGKCTTCGSGKSGNCEIGATLCV